MDNTDKQLQEKRKSNLRLLVTGVALIMFWRGLWGLMDVYLFPENLALSYLTSAAVGLTILYLNDFRLKELAH